jgi:hypothetical protein
MKNSKDAIRNGTRDLPTCSAVPQPNALPRAPLVVADIENNVTVVEKCVTTNFTGECGSR